MNTDFVIVRIENGVFAGLESPHHAIRRVAVITDGTPERVAAARPIVTESAIADAIRNFNACERRGAWHVLDDACAVAAEAQVEAAAACQGLADTLFALSHPRRPESDVADLLEAVADSADERAAARIALTRALEALDGLDEACARASEIVHGAADDGHHQAPLNYIDGGEHARH